MSSGTVGTTWKVAISSGLNLKFGSYFFGSVMKSGSVDRQASDRTVAGRQEVTAARALRSFLALRR